MKPKRAKPKLPVDAWALCGPLGHVYRASTKRSQAVRWARRFEVEFLPVTITARKAGKRRKKS